MGNTSAIDWLAIDATCPEFKLDVLTIVMAVIAIAGCVLNTILHFRLKKKEEEGSAFLNTLALFDFVICFFYLWVYTVTSFAKAYKSDFLAELRVGTQTTTKALVAYYESAMTLILFFLIFERYLWASTSEFRSKFKIFTVKTQKYWLHSRTILYVTLSTIITYSKGVQLSTVPFCDVALRPIEYENITLYFLQRYLFPFVIFFATHQTLFYAHATAIRLSVVFPPDEPVHQEGIDLTGKTEQKTRIVFAQFKPTIINMLSSPSPSAVIAATFSIRAAVHQFFIDPYTSSMYTKSMGERHAIMWWYDSMSVVFSATRYIILYLICRDRMVVDYSFDELKH